MTPEKSLVLASVTLGSFLICAYSLEQMNKRHDYLSLPSICNYFMFGFSSGMILTITKHMFKNENYIK